MSILLQSKTVCGTVFRKNSRAVWVSAANACTNAPGCDSGCGSCSGATQEMKIMVENKNPDTFAIGEQVTVNFHTYNEFITAMIVFGIPLFSTSISFAVWYFYSPSTVESGYSLITAGISFIIGLLIVKYVDHAFRRAYPASIVKVTPDTFSFSQYSQESTPHG